MGERNEMSLAQQCPGYQLYFAVANGKMPELRRLLEEGVPPDEFRAKWVPRSRHPAAFPPL